MAHYSQAPHCLYRLFQANGDLLYIGCSHAPMARIGAHYKVPVWGRLIAAATFEWFPDREACRRAEDAAIVAELPEWNVHGHPNPKHAIGRLDRRFDPKDPSTWVVRARHSVEVAA